MTELPDQNKKKTLQKRQNLLNVFRIFRKNQVPVFITNYFEPEKFLAFTRKIAASCYFLNDLTKSPLLFSISQYF